MHTPAPCPVRPARHLGEHLAGRRFGPLRLLRPLGQGGFAPVWLAEETFGGKRLREVAVKLFFLPEELAPASQEADRWRDSVAEEARALCRVEHPNVVRLYSLQRDDQQAIVGLVMEHVPGASLEALLAGAGPLEEAAVVEAGISVAWALAAVHDAGLVHRDVKPANVIRGPSGYKLIDFGIFSPIAREAGPAGREGGGTEGEPSARPLSGTPGYIAPECLYSGADATPASDLYALGVTLFRLLTAAAPGAAGRTLGAGAAPGSPALRDLLKLLVHPDPLARPRHADWVARRLERLRVRRGEPLRGPRQGARDKRSAPARQTSGAVDPTVRCAPAEMTSATSPDLRTCPPLVGRDRELSACARAIEAARRGAAQVVLLTGPMGIGRTRLLEAALDRAGAAAARVLRARCAPERRQPLRPLLDALGALPSVSAGGLGLLLDAVERALAPAELDGASPSRDEIEAIEEALMEASADAPLVVAIDDLQWGDASTLELLSRLARRAGEPGRLLVLAAVRDEPRASQALGALLARAGAAACPALRRLRLQPLSAQEAILLVQGMGPASLDLAQVVARGAGGVPALVVHALLAWRELGAIVWREGAWRPADGGALGEEVPGVADVLQVRLAACFEPGSPAALAARRALASVALHGGGLGADVMRRVLGDAAAADDVIQGLVSAGILELDPERRVLGFAQEMVRQAALNLTRQEPWFDRAHRALLDAIAMRRTAEADAGFLAAGYERLGDAPRARRWLRRAMQAAAAAGLFDEALALGDRLAALTSHPARRVEVELECVRAAIRGRAFEAGQQRLDRMQARSRGRRSGWARAADVAWRICWIEVLRGLGEEGAADPVLLADADALGDPVLACEARLALACVAPPAERLALAGEAVALAAGQGGALEFAARVRRLEINRGAARCDLALAEQDLRRAAAIASACGSTWHRIHVEADLAIIEADLDQVDAAIARLTRLSAEAEAGRMRGQLRLMLQNLAALLLRTGRSAEAAERAGQAARMAAEAGDPGLGARALSVRANALQRMGRLDAALESADAAARLQKQLGDPRRALTLLRRAEIVDALGRTTEAIGDAREAFQEAEAHGERDLCLSAALWERLRLAQLGAAPPAELERALAEAEAAPVTLRPLTRSLMARTRAWLDAERPTRED